MIVITGTLDIDPARLDHARAVFATMAAAAVDDRGCGTYGFWVDPADPARFRVYEEWESLDAIAEHMEQPHSLVFAAALPELGIVRSEVWRLDAQRLSKVG